MGEVFKLFGTIGINNGEANKSLDETEKKGSSTAKKLTGFFGNLSSKVSSSLSSIGQKIDFKGISSQFNKMGGAINSALVKGVKAGAKFVAVGGAATMAAAGAVLVKSMNLAGELEQNLGGSEAVFGKYANQMQKTGVNAFKTMGLSQSDFLANANKMGSLYQGAGFSVQESMSMTSDAMQRASDVASIMGIDVGSAMEAVSGMAKGNFEMMDNLGVAMNDTTIGNYALSKGIQKSTQQMTTQEKVGLATQMFMEKTAKYAGNYAKENDTLAGSLQTAKSALSNFMAGAGSIDAVIESGMNFAGIAGKSAMELAPKLFAGIMKAVQTLIPQIPTIVGNLAKSLADVIGEMFGKEAKTKFESLVGVMSQSVEGIKSAFGFIVKYKDIFTPIAVGIATVVASLSAWNIATKVWTATTKAATAIQTAFNTATKANVLSIVILAIIGVVSALTYFFTQTKTGIAVWKSFTTFLSNAWTTIEDKATEIFNALAKFLAGVWVTVVSSVTSFKNSVIEIWNSVKSTATEIFSGIASFLSGVWNGIVTVATAVWNVFYAVVGGIILSTINIIKGIFEGLGIYLGLFWDGIKAVALAIWGAIGTQVMAVINGYINIWKTIFTGFASVLSGIWNGIMTIASTVWNLIQSTVTTIIQNWINVLTPIFQFFANTLSAIWTGIVNSASVAWNGIKTTITTIVQAVINTVVPIFNGMRNTISSIFNGIRNIASTVWNGIRNTVSSVVSGIVSVATSLFNGMRNTISGIFNGIHSTISSIVNGVRNTISNVWSGLTGIVSGVFNGVRSAIEGPMNTAKNFIQGIVNSIKGFFNFSISWPKIPLPHFSINPKGWSIGDLVKGKIPSLGVDWYAKGGILTKPTAFGMNGNNLMVGGEAGAEAVAPIDTLLGYVKAAVNEVIGDQKDGDINVTQYISSPEPLTPREIARETKLRLQDLATLK
ncbi:TPA: hypothetical protein IXF72_001067 [Enterococcus faecium]|nr:hypothetical protein [Enterococcus faecium]